MLFIAAPARAAIFVVNSTNDAADANLTDNLCETATAGECTLRAAIEQANQTAGADAVNFGIAPFDGAVKTIAPASALPGITGAVTIDGYTQSGASANTAQASDNAVILIELSGANAGAGANGLTLFADDSTISGLAINRFGRVGISLAGGDNNVIAGNFVGTDASGAVDLGNGSVGIYGEFASLSNGNLIGGTTPAARNIISGNGNAGILFEFQAVNNIVRGNFVGLGADGATAIFNNGAGIGFGSFTGGTIIGGDDDDDGAADGVVNSRNYISGNAGSGIFLGSGVTVLGNYIGTDATGALARPNSGGIATNAGSGTIIGGAAAGAGNLISGNTGDGIAIGNSSNLIVRNNLIGTTANGISSLPNGGDGVEIATGGGNNQIGGAALNEGNLIAFNGEDGVQLDDVGAAPTGNPILGNSIHSNDGLGINLGVDGVTGNDAGDTDGGANRRQNFPVITLVQTGSTRIAGTFNSTANTNFRLEFFNSPAADASGSGEGQTFIGALNLTTDGGGNAAFDQTFAPTTAIGSFVSATATNLSTNDTSEFSNAKQVFAPTAAAVSIGGRVMTAAGRGIFGARVAMTDAGGTIRYAMTNPFGYYNFAAIPAGATYAFVVAHKRYEFMPRVVSVGEDLRDFDFIDSTKTVSGAGF